MHLVGGHLLALAAAADARCRGRRRRRPPRARRWRRSAGSRPAPRCRCRDRRPGGPDRCSVDTRCTFRANPAWSAPTAMRIMVRLYRESAAVWRRVRGFGGSEIRSATRRGTIARRTTRTVHLKTQTTSGTHIDTVTISPRGEERLLGGHPWIYRSDVARVDAGGGEIVEVRSSRGRPLGYALYSDRSEIAIRVLTRGAEPPDDGALAAAHRRRRSRYRASLQHRRHRVSAGARRSGPAAVADRRSLRRLPGDADAVAGHRSAAAGDRRRRWSSWCSRPASWPGTIRASAQLEGLERKVEVVYGTVPETIEVREAGVALRGRSVSRPEDRAVSRSAREPRGGGALRARAAARRVQLQRRLRAGAGAAVHGGPGGRHLGGRGRADRGQRGAQSAARTSRRGR